VKPANRVFASYDTTVFEVYSRLAREHQAVNLGQGFPDQPGPPDLLQRAAEALLSGSNQYPPMLGIPALRQAVAAHERRFYGLEIDWETEVMVTSGATEALAACLFGLLNPSDEAVLIEPMYDSYLPVIRAAGAEARFVPLTPPDWHLDAETLAAAFTPRTRVIVLNNPLNPAGKAFTPSELALVAEAAQRHDCTVICDEVYEHLTFDGRRHTPLMAMPGMRDRCLKIGSAGKTFSVTGWKVGLVTGAPDLLQPAIRAHQFLTFTTPPNLQEAVAYGLGKPDAYFDDLAQEQQGKRNRLAAGLRGLGFAVLPATGTYFLVANFTPLADTLDCPSPREGRRDDAVCRRLVTEAGVCTIPLSAFYASGSAPDTLIRFCFCKQDAVLDEAVARLERFLQACHTGAPAC